MISPLAVPTRVRSSRSRFPLRLEAKSQRLGLFEPFEFLAESTLEAHQQNLVAGTLEGAPSPWITREDFLEIHKSNSFFSP